MIFIKGDIIIEKENPAIVVTALERMLILSTERDIYITVPVIDEGGYKYNLAHMSRRSKEFIETFYKLDVVKLRNDKINKILD